MSSVFERLAEAMTRARAETEQPVSQTKEWALKLGMKVVVDPEVGCPKCEEWVRTNRVWLLDETDEEVVRVWDLGSEGRRSVWYVHPHVSGDGKVCRGAAKSIGEALWGRVNSVSVFWDPKEWFEELGHDCDSWDEDEEEEIDEEESFYCDGCEESFDDENEVSYYSEAEQRLCGDCWSEVSDCCERCQVAIYVRRSGLIEVSLDRHNVESWCRRCVNGHAKMCDECEEMWDRESIEEIEGEEFCPACLNDKTNECDGCEKTCLDVNLEENKDSRVMCRECRPAGLEELEGKGQTNWLDLTMEVNDVSIEA